MKINTGKRAEPRRILLYGQHGVGKSTWAAEAPSPIFLDVEGGLNDIACDKSERLNTFGDVVSAVSWLITNPNDYKTVAIDTLDWLQTLIHKQVSQDAGKNSIEEIGYGKGYKFALEKWHFLIKGLDALRAKGKTIILLAHAKIEAFDSPEAERYDRYEPALHESASAIVQEWCDEVLFASFRVFTRTEDLGFGQKRQIALGGKERFIRTNESAAAIAKNRLRLPDELPLTWAAYAAHLPQPASVQQAKPAPMAGDSIAGVVVDGSSKV